ncbi:MAG: helix-turn-helix domain-containing protein [Alphaproteobacteria bacterium]|nr:MAG: helix-turn-helix domain-containing protein [Alphaproteobacteria bacterium]
MAETRHLGARIRERRLAAGLRQTDLAKAVGISPAYLNLIEHDRRRIGGKLLVDLAAKLGLEPGQLAAGADEAQAGALRDAAGRMPEAGAESDQAEALAGRFPGWARLIGAQAQRIEALERLVETLSDRLAHDPHLAASIHEVVSATTAIRAAASILAEPDVPADWRARFLRSLGEESRRLAESAEGLIAWLDAGREDLGETALSPVDELGAFVARSGYHYPELEAPAAGEGQIAEILSREAGRMASGADELVRAMLARYLDDARAMPRPAFEAALEMARARPGGDDPARLAAGFGVGIDAVLRRMASLGGEAAGLITCDGTGALLLRKPVEGFPIPRFGAACGLWPLFQALARPAQPVEAVLEMPGALGPRFRARAIALPRGAGGFGGPLLLEATMLVEPLPGAEAPAAGVVAAGGACRVCPRLGCPARREPSILRAEAPG